MLAQVWKERKAGVLELPASFVGEFERRFEQLTLGNIAWLVRVLGKAITTNSAATFLPELKEVLNDRFYASLDQWVPERNEIGHYQVNLTGEDRTTVCGMWRTAWRIVGRTSAFQPLQIGKRARDPSAQATIQGSCFSTPDRPLEQFRFRFQGERCGRHPLHRKTLTCLKNSGILSMRSWAGPLHNDQLALQIPGQLFTGGPRHLLRS
ncbi:MAG: hypothetical protein IPO87_12630 [Flavobacteriales bacterium]|nr:hypothetical protein [Flavobacteriales bacterium]